MSKSPSEKEAVNLLAKAGCSPKVIRHCKAVADLATRTAKKIAGNEITVDVDLVRIGALLHDIGRAKTHELDHAIKGVDIARSFSIPEPIIHIIERHIGSGMTAVEAARMGLPKRSFLPQSLEEKIVSYSDKLIEGSQELGFEEALTSFSMKLGRALGAPAISRFKKLHNELATLTGATS